MNKIQVLPDVVRNKIAAGEIIERPAAVLKELIENAIDAGSSRIEVDIEQAGCRLIRVTDNGYGMTREDALLSLERYSTSKLQKETDLERIQTFGFRGEALPSIASVARLQLVTATSDAPAVEIQVEGGAVKSVRETAAPPGTRVEVEDLFYNTPARRKFMKTQATELSHIIHTFQRLALPHPEIHFRLTHNSQDILVTPSVRNLRDRILQIMGEEWFDHLLEVSKRFSHVALYGFISNPPFSFASRDHQEFFVNKRAIRSPLLIHALSEAYSTSMMKGRYPAAVLFLEMPFDHLDVNVHPMKREVRFHQQQEIHDKVHHAIKGKLQENVPVVKEMRSETVNGYEGGTNGLGPALLRESVEAYQIMDESNSRVRTAVMMPSVHPLGQIDQTYIVAQIEGDLHIVDQHAAHERVLFDRLMDQLKGERLELQPLLFSETVTLSPALAARIREILPVLKEAGLELEEFGQHAFLIRSLPALLGPVNAQQLLLDLLEDLDVEKSSMVQNTPLQQVMASMACHGAIKAHQGLVFDQMSELLRDINTASASTCPHGRPIRMTFSRSDLEKLFHRK